AYYALAAARLAGIGLPLAGALLWALLVPGVAFAAFLLGWLLVSRSAGSVMAVGGLSMSYCWGLAAPQRGALPEVLTVPLALIAGGALAGLRTPGRLWPVLLGALAGALLIVAHPLSAALHVLWLGPLAAVIAGSMAPGTRRRYVQACLAMIVGALALSAWYWLPMAAWRGDVQLQRFAITPVEFVRNAAMVVPSIFAGPLRVARNASFFAPVANCPLGWWLGPLPGLSLLGLAVFPRRLWTQFDGLSRRLVVVSLLAAIAFTLLTTRPLVSIWGGLPGAGMLQFPWRLLLPASCWALLLSGVALAPLARMAAEAPWRPRRWLGWGAALLGALFVPWPRVMETIGVILFGLGLQAPALMGWLHALGVELPAILLAAGGLLAAAWLVKAAGSDRLSVLALVCAAALVALVGAPRQMRQPFARGEQEALDWSAVVATDAPWPELAERSDLPFLALWPEPTRWPTGVALDFVPGFLPRWVTQAPEEPGGGWARLVNGRGIVLVTAYTGMEYHLTGETEGPATVEVGAFYFPGWQARSDAAAVRCYPSPRGLVRLDLPGGPCRVRLFYGRAPIALWADVTSGVSLLVLLAAGLAAWRKRKRHQWA
ncbi:MAG: hypothetical protein AB7Y46_14480, partial [Armatimonadota bacterium]